MRESFSKSGSDDLDMENIRSRISSLYEKNSELKNKIGEYTQASSQGSLSQTVYAREILELSNNLGLLDLLDIKLTYEAIESIGLEFLKQQSTGEQTTDSMVPMESVGPKEVTSTESKTPPQSPPPSSPSIAKPQMSESEAIQSIGIYLETLESELIPFGLHTFGKSPENDSALTTAEKVVEANPGLSVSDVLNRLNISGDHELESLFWALEGRYILPSEGNDPIRSPDSIPTGRNFYGLSPGKMPTPAAWELGQLAADELIKKYRSEKGEYPQKVAIVLWAVESLRSEGVTEATILALIGVEPTWYPSGTVSGFKVI
ncbi:MAG: cobaltochelatase subunit CobN, partial [Synergistaceae bacterium]|nr:cobaltochelatase subunit CobN [Synergistaceae bacterium]